MNWPLGRIHILNPRMIQARQALRLVELQGTERTVSDTPCKHPKKHLETRYSSNGHTLLRSRVDSSAEEHRAFCRIMNGNVNDTAQVLVRARFMIQLYTRHNNLLLIGINEAAPEIPEKYRALSDGPATKVDTATKMQTCETSQCKSSQWELLKTVVNDLARTGFEKNTRSPKPLLDSQSEKTITGKLRTVQTVACDHALCQKRGLIRNWCFGQTIPTQKLRSKQAPQIRIAST